MKQSYTLANKWTRWDEITQRLRLCRNFLKFAWLCLWWDSTAFAAVFYNASRQAGDELIAEIKVRGKTYDLRS